MKIGAAASFPATRESLTRSSFAGGGPWRTFQRFTCATERAKRKNRVRVERAASAGRLQVHLGTNLEQITPRSIVLEDGARRREIPNDNVIVCAGGVLPSTFLKSLGIETTTKYGDA